MRISSLIFITLLSFVFLSAPANAVNYVFVSDKCTTDRNESRPSELHGHYRGKRFTDFYKIPKKTRKSILNNIKQRVGDKFLSEIKFHDGVVINPKEIDKRDEYTPEQLRRMPSYVLAFSVPISADKCVFLDVHARNDGSLTSEMKWPNIAKKPNTWPLISYAAARSVAASNGFDGDSDRPVLNYDASGERFFYSFSSTIKKGQHMLYLVDAQSGKFFKKVKQIPIY